MQYTGHYDSPIGSIFLAADDIGLTGLWFEGQKYFARGLSSRHEEKSLPVFEKTKCWLDVYFSGREPDFMPPVHPVGSDFRLAVWDMLHKIPYGKTTTYGRIAGEIAGQNGLSKVSARAVGNAVGHNGISIIVPCHRVIGSDGSLTGYAGGIEKKAALLKLEHASLQQASGSVSAACRAIGELLNQ